MCTRDRDKVTRTPSMEINLIGMTVEEALHEADKFIDNGVMNGQTTLYLICLLYTSHAVWGMLKYAAKTCSVQ